MDETRLELAHRILAVLMFGMGAVMVSGVLASSVAQLNAQSIYQSARSAVVLVEAGLTGTGFIVHPNGCVFTAAHVIGSESQETIRVQLADGRSFEDVNLLSFDNKNDIAILKIEGDDFPALELGGTDDVRELDEVVTIGYPKPDVLATDTATASAGRIEAVRDNVTYGFGFGRKAILEKAYQVSGTIRPGSSGGPVLNADGKVIGVVAATPETSELSSTAFASPIGNASIPQNCRSSSIVGDWVTPVVIVLGLVVVGSAGYWTARRLRRPNAVRTLRQVSLFSELSDEELNGVYRQCQLQTYSPGDYVIQEGDLEGHELYVIVQGQVEIRHKDRLLAKRGVGRTIGEMALLSGNPRSADAIATRQTQCLVLARSELRALYRDHPDIALKMMKDLYLRTQEADYAPSE